MGSDRADSALPSDIYTAQQQQEGLEEQRARAACGRSLPCREEGKTTDRQLTTRTGTAWEEVIGAAVRMTMFLLTANSALLHKLIEAENDWSLRSKILAKVIQPLSVSISGGGPSLCWTVQHCFQICRAEDTGQPTQGL